MAMVTHEALLAMFGVRFDAWSARAVCDETLGWAGVGNAARYSGEQLLELARVLEDRKGRDRVEEVVELLRDSGKQALASQPAAVEAKPSPTPPKPAEDKSKKKPEQAARK